MAGTTVRDDGAVEAAFTAALAAVGIVARDPRARGGPGRSCATPWGGPRRTCSPRSSSPRGAAGHGARSPPPTRRSSPPATSAEVPGALAVLRGLRDRGVQVCLTTGFAPSTRDALLDALGWRDEIDLALSPADVGRGRPAPDMILGAMDRLGVDDPGAVAVVGDTVSDLEAGARGGRRGGRRRPERRPRRGDALGVPRTRRSSPT